MRRHGRTDRNQIEIVRALRQVGASVLVLSMVGKGAPDILCGFRGVNHAMEIKDPLASPSDRKLTVDERIFHATWRGQIDVVETVEEALVLIGAARGGRK